MERGEEKKKSEKEGKKERRKEGEMRRETEKREIEREAGLWLAWAQSHLSCEEGGGAWDLTGKVTGPKDPIPVPQILYA